MEVKKTYIAFDGKTFDNESDCVKYEGKLRSNVKNEILQEIKDLDLAIWKKYHPDDEEGNEPELHRAAIWLNNDIAAIMIEFPESEEDILSLIKAAKHGREILNNYINMDSIRKKVAVKSDFLSALRSVKNGSDLSSAIEWSLSARDLSELAKLHKAKKCRRKIEDLLTDCNFHYECGKFMNNEYDEFLQEKNFKLRIYVLSGNDHGKLDHEEFFATREEMNHRYDELFKYRNFSLNPTGWEKVSGKWKRLEEY